MAAAVFAGKEGEMLAVGTTAPDFTLSTHEGDTVRLAGFRGRKYVVLIFYPGDATPGCTKQLCEIRDDYTQFTVRNAEVFGVNPASGKSHKSFADKHRFQFPLLIDDKSTVAGLYGTKGTLMTKRTVYVISPEGKIIFARRGKPSVTDILAVIPDKNGPETKK
jgi:thioredoxin-dependent peroxiredoxin